MSFVVANPCMEDAQIPYAYKGTLYYKPPADTASVMIKRHG